MVSRRRMKPGRKCPKCRTTKVIRKGYNRQGHRVYKCLSCNLHFTSSTGSILYRMRISKEDFIRVCEELGKLPRNGSIQSVAKTTNLGLRTVKSIIRRGEKDPIGLIRIMLRGKIGWLQILKILLSINTITHTPTQSSNDTENHSTTPTKEIHIINGREVVIDTSTQEIVRWPDGTYFVKHKKVRTKKRKLLNHYIKLD